MTKIKNLIDEMDEEICGAKKYAEMYVEAKAKNDQIWTNRYSEMAQDELKHGMYIHEKIVKEIEELSKVFKVPEKMQKKWDESHVEYVDKVAWVKQMLQM